MNRFDDLMGVFTDQDDSVVSKRLSLSWTALHHVLEAGLDTSVESEGALFCTLALERVCERILQHSIEQLEQAQQVHHLGEARCRIALPELQVALRTHPDLMPFLKNHDSWRLMLVHFVNQKTAQVLVNQAIALDGDSAAHVETMLATSSNSSFNLEQEDTCHDARRQLEWQRRRDDPFSDADFATVLTCLHPAYTLTHEGLVFLSAIVRELVNLICASLGESSEEVLSSAQLIEATLTCVCGKLRQDIDSSGHELLGRFHAPRCSSLKREAQKHQEGAKILTLRFCKHLSPGVAHTSKVVKHLLVKFQTPFGEIFHHMNKKLRLGSTLEQVEFVYRGSIIVASDTPSTLGLSSTNVGNSVVYIVAKKWWHDRRRTEARRGLLTSHHHKSNERQIKSLKEKTVSKIKMEDTTHPLPMISTSALSSSKSSSHWMKHRKTSYEYAHKPSPGQQPSPQHRQTLAQFKRKGRKKIHLSLDLDPLPIFSSGGSRLNTTTKLLPTSSGVQRLESQTQDPDDRYFDQVSDQSLGILNVLTQNQIELIAISSLVKEIQYQASSGHRSTEMNFQDQQLILQNHVDQLESLARSTNGQLQQLLHQLKKSCLVKKDFSGHNSNSQEEELQSTSCIIIEGPEQMKQYQTMKAQEEHDDDDDDDDDAMRKGKTSIVINVQTASFQPEQREGNISMLRTQKENDIGEQLQKKEQPTSAAEQKCKLFDKIVEMEPEKKHHKSNVVMKDDEEESMKVNPVDEAVIPLSLMLEKADDSTVKQRDIEAKDGDTPITQDAIINEHHGDLQESLQDITPQVIKSEKIVGEDNSSAQSNNDRYNPKEQMSMLHDSSTIVTFGNTSETKEATTEDLSTTEQPEYLCTQSNVDTQPTHEPVNQDTNIAADRVMLHDSPTIATVGNTSEAITDPEIQIEKSSDTTIDHPKNRESPRTFNNPPSHPLVDNQSPKKEQALPPPADHSTTSSSNVKKKKGCSIM